MDTALRASGYTRQPSWVDQTVYQTDRVEDLDDEDKLDPPMVEIGWERGIGRFERLARIGSRERTFPGVDGRLRPPLVVAGDRALYESEAEDEGIDLPLRWGSVLGKPLSRRVDLRMASHDGIEATLAH